MCYVNEENIFIFLNLTGWSHTYMHITSSYMTDIFINATRQHVSGTISLDMSDQRLILFLHIMKKIQTVLTVECA